MQSSYSYLKNNTWINQFNFSLAFITALAKFGFLKDID
jgi:hypothetical protein